MNAGGIEPFARAVVAALALGVGGSAVLASAVWVWIRAFRSNATTRHAAWWIALATSALFPMACLATSLTRVVHVATVARYASPSNSMLSRERLPGTGWGLVRRTTPRLGGDSAVAPANANLRARASWRDDVARVFPHTALPWAVDVDVALVTVWLVVMLARAAALLRRLAALRRLKAAAPVFQGPVAQRLRRWRHSTRSGRPVALRISEDVDVPVAVGFRRPAILLPLRVTRDASAADLDQIALHEQAHLNRYDDWTNLLERVISCLLWFNPVMWWLLGRISLEREIACDDRVIAQTGRAHRYATCLWKLVRASSLPTVPILAPGALFTSRQITTRIEQLLDPRRNALPRLSPSGALFSAMCGIGVVILQTQQAPAITVADAKAVRPALHASPPVRAAVPPSTPGGGQSWRRRPPFPARKLVRHLQAVRTSAHLERVHEAPKRADLPRKLTDALRRANVERDVHAALHRVNVDRTVNDALRRADVGRIVAQSLEGAAGDPVGSALTGEIDRAVETAVTHNVAAQTDQATLRAHVAQAVRAALVDGSAPESEERAVMVAQHRGRIRDLPAFHRIVFDTSVRVEVRRSTRSRIDFGDDTDAAQHTTTDVDDGTLTIDGSGSWNDGNTLVTIETPSLDDIEVDGSSSVVIDEVRAQHLGLRMSGSGSINVAGGFAPSAAIQDEGSGTIDLERLRTDATSVSVEGSGSVTLSAPRTLTLAIDGSGDIDVHGHAQALASQINGSGRIIQE